MFWLLVAMAYAEVPKVIPDAHIRGKELYDELCFQCHGTTGLADSAMAKSTNAPSLAGKIDAEGYSNAIGLIQAGKGLMPAYEMVIDKHDTKRILIYLSRLDSETGLDPNAPETSDSKSESTSSETKTTGPSTTKDDSDE